MHGLGLFTLTVSSYLLTQLVWSRLRLLLRPGPRIPPESLRRVHLAGVFAPLTAAAPEVAPVADAALRGALTDARRGLSAATGLSRGQRAWAEGALDLAEAEHEPSRWKQRRLAGRARLFALLAARQAPSPALDHLYLQATLGYLTDWLNLAIVLRSTARRLRRALAASGQDPLLHLSAALRAAVAADTTEALQALGRALYHARGDPFVPSLIASLPNLPDLAPALAAQAATIRGRVDL